jgi:CubicO group peptidase (beta-lactamase class C family)
MSTALLASIAIAASLPGRTQEQEPPTFQAIVQPYIDRGLMAGAIGVVVNKSEVLNFPTVGYADLEAKKPMQRDTLFWIASTSKTFQATALMMLVDDGKVRLDDPVSKYLPDLKPRIAVKDADGKETLREPARAITVRMLLNHTTGLQYADPAVATRTDCCSLTAEVARFVSLPLTHEPGTKFAYQNAGPDTSSRIVEVVSGKDFETLLNERLLQPLGMKDTTYFPNEEQLSRLAVVYWFSPTEKKLVRAPQEVFLTLPYSDRKIRHAPGGGLFSTGGDLARFAQMFLGNGMFESRRYLSESAVEQMTHSQLSPEVLPPCHSLPAEDPISLPTDWAGEWGQAGPISIRVLRRPIFTSIRRVATRLSSCRSRLPTQPCSRCTCDSAKHSDSIGTCMRSEPVLSTIICMWHRYFSLDPAPSAQRSQPGWRRMTVMM